MYLFSVPRVLVGEDKRCSVANGLGVEDAYNFRGGRGGCGWNSVALFTWSLYPMKPRIGGAMKGTKMAIMMKEEEGRLL